MKKKQQSQTPLFWCMKWIITLFVIYTGWCIFLYFSQEKVIFPETKELAHSPGPRDVSVEDTKFITSDGKEIFGWWMETEGADKTILFFQTNNTNISHLLAQLFIFQKVGVNALVFDFRGYGRSEGEILREEDVYLDGQAALDFLVQEKVLDPKSLVLWGRAIGTGVATHLASKNDIGGLILEAPFTSLPDLGHFHYPFLPIEVLLKYRFENDQKIGQIEAPLLIFHSEEDEKIPFSHSKELFERA